jgi:hypothetical protein
MGLIVSDDGKKSFITLTPGEGGTQDGVDLNRGQHRPNAVKLLLQLDVLARVLARKINIF